MSRALLIYAAIMIGVGLCVVPCFGGFVGVIMSSALGHEEPDDVVMWATIASTMFLYGLGVLLYKNRYLKWRAEKKRQRKTRSAARAEKPHAGLTPSRQSKVRGGSAELNHRAFDIELPEGGQKPVRAGAIEFFDEALFFVAGNTYNYGSRSQNKVWLVGANAQEGTVSLFHLPSNSVTCTVRFHRPNDLAVGNNGVVVVGDWLDSGELGAAIVILAPNGVPLFQRKIGVNVLEVGISQMGDRAYYKTAGGQYLAEANQIVLLDVVDREEVYRVDSSYDVAFYGSKLAIVARSAEGEQRLFPFNDNGEEHPGYKAFLKREQVKSATSNPANAIRVLSRETGNKEPDWDFIREIIDAVKLSEAQLDDRGLAKLRRFEGELAEFDGELISAADLWREALELDERVGVKGKLKKLEKDIESLEL